MEDRACIRKLIIILLMMVFLAALVSVTYAQTIIDFPDINEDTQYWNDYYLKDTPRNPTNSNIYLDIMKLEMDTTGKEQTKKSGGYKFRIKDSTGIIRKINNESEWPIENRFIVISKDSDDSSFFYKNVDANKYHYKFYLEEVKEGKTGITYDNQTITVEVYSFVDSQGERHYATYYKNDKDEYIAPATFINKYDSTDSDVAKKVHEEEKYPYGFAFTKKWTGASTDDVSFSLYRPDGTEINRGYKRDLIKQDKNTWEIMYWFDSDPTGCYAVEKTPNGYVAVYQNPDNYKNFKDRIFNGGTIINVPIPTTGDHALTNLLFMLAALGLTGVLMCIIVRKTKS